jgi:hypothetical protein
MIILGSKVSPLEGQSWAGHTVGTVLDIWFDGDSWKVEVRWSNGDEGIWDESQLRLA